jgi:cephalosporin-C deacetylase-like acetyl esterase
MSLQRVRRAVLILLTLCLAHTVRAGQFLVTPDHADGIYRVGEPIHFAIRWLGDDAAPAAEYSLKKGGLAEIAKGPVALNDGNFAVDSKLDEPGTLLLEIRSKGADGKTVKALGGVVAGTDQIRPSAPRPKDFDAFWADKIKELESVPPNVKLEEADGGKPGVHYWKLTMDNIRGTHIHGQLARPESGDKLPALLIVQWAGVYPLQKAWATDRAAEGWLVLNVIAHDLPIDEPESFYKDQMTGALKDYAGMGNDDRDASYFLRMYLGDYRAAEYLTHREDWDGKTLVVMGTSQGGQQTLVMAGLHPKITAALACVPAGCDMLGPDVGRKGGWPNWYNKTEGRDPAKVHEASRYFDAVNFASRIKCPILIGIGLIDEVCPPAGVLAAANVIPAPKEVIVLPVSGHQNEHGSQEAYNRRCYNDWLPALRAGKPPPIASSGS